MAEEEDPMMSIEAMMDAILKMKTMVEELYNWAWEKFPKEEESLVRDEGEGVGGDHLEPPSSPSSSLSESEHSSYKKKSPHFNDFPLLKLDVKFDLLVYDG